MAEPTSELPDRTHAGYKGGRRIVKDCKVCGQPFLIAPGLAGRYSTCSDDCRTEGYRRPQPTEKLCSRCGELRPASEYYIEQRTGRPASVCKFCRADIQREQIVAAKIRRAGLPPGPIPDRTPLTWRGSTRIEQVCAVCGNRYLIAPGHAGKVSTCSIDCSLTRRRKVEGSEQRCSRCGVVKPVSEFYRTRKGTLLAHCKQCDKEMGQHHREANPEPYRIAKRDYRRRIRLGMTYEEYQALKLTLRDDCAICGSTDRLCSDHDHTTNQFRDILCNRCNNVLGRVGDDPILLRRLVGYLEHHAAAPPLKLEVIPRPPEGFARCARCGQVKALSDFTSGYCRECHNEAGRLSARRRRNAGSA